jgi:type IV pilus assembly protein PilC
VAKFQYAAVRPDGTRVTGVQKARDRKRAERILQRRQLRNIRLTEKKGVMQIELTKPKASREEIMHMSRQLAAFVRAGLPLIEAVHTLGEEAKNSTMRNMLADVQEGLERGEAIWSAMDRHPHIFPEFYRGIVRSAEVTGRLDEVLDQVSTYLERDIEIRRRLKAAMIYPTMIIGMSILTVVVLASFVLPRFKEFFNSLGATLPLPTRMLLWVTDFLTGYWIPTLAVLGAVVATIFFGVRTTGGRKFRDRLYLKLPIIGQTVQIALVERFCRVLGSMANSGVSLPEGLRVATESLRNVIFMNALADVGEAMLEGEGLAGPLADTGLFPITAARMIRVGEDTGTLHVQLEFAARYYESELDYKIKNMVALIEPTVILGMGLIVGFVAIALVSAMYGIYRQVKV